MNDKKKQSIRFSDEELALIKTTFAENEDLLKVLRRVFLQMPLSATDLSLLHLNFKGKPELMKVVRKTFVPELDGDVPLGQQVDLFLTIGLKEMMPDVGAVHLESIKIWRNYTEQQLNVLESGEYEKEQPLTLKALADFGKKLPTEIYVEMLARNCIVNNTEGQLMQLLILAGRKEDSVGKTKEKMDWQNSNK